MTDSTAPLRPPREPRRASAQSGIADERGVSFTVSYVLTLAIATLLIAGVILAAGQVVRNERERTIEDQATVIADKVAASAMAADRLVVASRDSPTPTVSVAADLPDRIAGEPYAIRLATGGSSPVVVVETQTPSVRVEVPLANRTAIEANATDGGPIHVEYLPDQSALTLEDGSR